MLHVGRGIVVGQVENLIYSLAELDAFTGIVADGLRSSSDRGFLLRLSYAVYRLFESIVSDLALEAGPVRRELEASRVARDPESADLLGYNSFLIAE